MLQGLDQLVLGALSRIGSAVVAVGLVLFEDVIDRNQQAVGDRDNGAFVSPTRRDSAINRSKISSLAAHRRAGVEGTPFQEVNVFGLRQSRYRSLAKTHLQPVLSSVAINVVRMVAWL